MSLNKEQMREYQRKRRAAERDDIGVMMENLPWPYNEQKSPRWGEGVERYVPPSLEELKAMGRLSEKVFTVERVVDREGRPLKCALPTCGKVFTTTLPLMRFCCREHQIERLEQLDTRR